MDDYDLSEFLASNEVIELDVQCYFWEELTFNDSFYRSIKCLKITDDKYIDLKNFKSLRLLNFSVNTVDLARVIPYLASIFDQDQFKKM